MMLWLVRRRPDRNVMFAASNYQDAVRWAARHMGYPDGILDADLLPECIFWFEIAEVRDGHPGESAVAYVGYTDWEIGAEDEDPGAFHVIITTDNSPSVRIFDALIPLTERNHP